MKNLFTFIFILFTCQLSAQICYNNATPSDPDSGVLGFITRSDLSDLASPCPGRSAISELQLSGDGPGTVKGMMSFGFGTRAKNFRTIADEFTLTEAATLSTVKLYPYKNTVRNTNANTQIIEEAYIRIWNGMPGAAGSQIIHGDLVTNVLVSSTFTGVYRVNDVNDTYCERPIMEVIADLKCKTLNPGTYWLEWQFSVKVDFADFSNIYKSVPLTQIGVATTGNAVKSLDDGITYSPVVDSGTKTAQGFPFIIDCKPFPEPVPTLGEWGLISLSLLLLIVGVSSIKQHTFTIARQSIPK